MQSRIIPSLDKEESIYIYFPLANDPPSLNSLHLSWVTSAEEIRGFVIVTHESGDIGFVFLINNDDDLTKNLRLSTKKWSLVYDKSCQPRFWFLPSENETRTNSFLFLL